jgi:prolyl-tRNA editing enzyme YbaK/EbsC (Cys-tRNA(Pro) deacylase)
LNDKKVELAPHSDVERITGFRVGAVSVLGFRRQGVPVYLDTRIFAMDKVLISGGRPGLGLMVVTADLAKAFKSARREDVCQG